MKIRAIIFFIWMSVIGYAQNTNIASPNTLDDQYTPDKSSDLYNPNSANKRSISSGTDIKNVITYDVGQTFRCVASVHYERVLFKYMSIQASAGVTFARDVLQSVFIDAGMVNQNNNNYNEVSLSNMLKNASRHNAGLFLSGGIKVYFNGEAPDRVFIQPCVSYYQYNLQLNSNYQSQLQGASPYVTFQNMDYKLHWGCQFVNGDNKVRFVHTVYVGMGIRTITYNRLINTYNNYTYLQELSWGSKNMVLVPTISFGYCLGLGF